MNYNYEDEEFYGEPSGFDNMVEDFKKTLKNSVKDTVTNEMDQLRRENDELKDIKLNWYKVQSEYESKKKSLENEYQSKNRALEREKSDLVNKVRRDRLSELMKDFQVILYHADTISQKKSKCDKCDENRKIHFLSPAGKDCTEYCECSNTVPIYIPIEYKCSEFKIDSNNNKSLSMWFEEKVEKDYDYYHSTTYVDYVYDGNKSYDEIYESKKHIFFKSKDDCQKYCNWLNNKKGYQEISKNPVAVKN